MPLSDCNPQIMVFPPWKQFPLSAYSQLGSSYSTLSGEQWHWIYCEIITQMRFQWKKKETKICRWVICVTPSLNTHSCPLHLFCASFFSFVFFFKWSFSHYPYSFLKYNSNYKQWFLAVILEDPNKCCLLLTTKFAFFWSSHAYMAIK